MENSVEGAEQEEKEISTSRTGSESPVMDRNPSPPPDAAETVEEEDLDAIGDTVYSKHWLFSTLTRLIHMVTEQSEENCDGQTQLSDDDEGDLCKVWDMAMDKDVASFLQEFKATDILLGVIAKSRCPRLTEISVGILGNIACFPETCASLSQNEDLGSVLLLLLGDTDPPTILETSRLLLTCLSQKGVRSLWLQRIRQHASVRNNLCFIMCSSTNTDLLERVGELTDKLFDLDEDLMKAWITAPPSEEKENDSESHVDVTLCLLEAAKQLRSENLNSIEVYFHILHLLTTVDEGVQVFASPDGPAKLVWDFVSGVVCEELCQPSDPPLVLHEQKGILVQTFAVLQALYKCQDRQCNESDTILPLVVTLLRVCQYHTECKDSFTNEEDQKDKELQTLAEITAEFLAHIFNHIPKDIVVDLVKQGYLTEKVCLTAAASLLPEFKTSLQHLQGMLSETDPQLADVLRRQFPV